MKENLAASRPAARAAAAAHRAWAAMLAVALCMGLMPSFAGAAESSTAAAESWVPMQGTASLTIAYDGDGDGVSEIVLNKVYGFYASATLGDLFAAAKEAGDVRDYAFADSGYGSYVESITLADGTVLANAADYSNYWSTYKDGEYASGDAGQEGEALASGVAYQFEWASWPSATAAVDWSAVGNPTVSTTMAGSAGSDADADADTDTDTDTETDADSGDSGSQATTVDEAVFVSLFQNIANSYEGTSEEWKALALAAIGNASSVDVDTLVANAKASLSDHGTTNLQRYILALTAVGETEVAAELVDAMATSPTATSQINGQIFALLAYDSGSYSIPENAAMTEDELVSAILSAQLSSGGWAWSGDTADADITAMALTALASRASEDSEVAAAVERGIVALRTMQYEDGGFRAAGADATSPVNANTTAYVVMAMCALGIDPATSWATEDGSTPLSALLSQATSDNTAFLYNGEADDMATYQGFLALVAYQGLKNTGAAYNVYTQAKLGQAGLNIEGEEESAAEESGSDDSSETGALAKTGDPVAPFAAGVAAVALCALASGITASRRMRAARDLSSRR